MEPEKYRNNEKEVLGNDMVLLRLHCVSQAA